MKNIVIVSHKYLPQPDDDLIYYLNTKKKYKCLHIAHAFPDEVHRRSSFSLYIKGKKRMSGKSFNFILFPEIIIYAKEFFFTLYWSLLMKSKIDIFIGMDGLCSFFGIILKKLGICKRVIYWSIDFVPGSRFQNSWKNYIYNKINTFMCRNADEVWDLSPRMAEGRKKYLKVNLKDYKYHNVVPYGVWVKRIKRVTYDKCQKNTLVFMGHLLSKQGVDSVLKKVPLMVKKIPGFKFKIIGEGNFKSELVNLAKDLNIEKYCEFLGKIETKELEEEIAMSAVAIAPYKNKNDSYTYYADPGKVKTYLACGVPLLLTDFPWNAKEIERKRCGLILKDDGSDWVEKLTYVMKPKINSEFRKNAIRYSKQFDYEDIFSRLDL